MQRIWMIGGVVLGLLLSCGYAEQNKTAPVGKKQFTFKGKVEKVDAGNKTLSVKNEKVEGRMDSMTMNYVPDKEDEQKRVKPGDEITAKVYDGDNRTLYDIQFDTKQPDTKAAPAGKK